MYHISQLPCKIGSPYIEIQSLITGIVLCCWLTLQFVALWWFLVERGCLPSLSSVLQTATGCYHLLTRSPWASLYVELSYLSCKPSTYCHLQTCPAFLCLCCLERLLGSCWWLKKKMPLNLRDCLKGSFQRYTKRKARCIDDSSFLSFFRSCPGLLYNKGIHLHKYLVVSIVLGPSLEHLNCFVM